MAKATTDDTYDADTTALTRPADLELSERLTGEAAIEELAQRLKNAALELEPDDLETLHAADALQITDEDDYQRGFDLLSELGTIETKITAHYNRFDKPLNFLIGVVRKLKKPQMDSVAPLKTALSRRLGTWKAERERLDREAREHKQAIDDAAARAAQEAKAAVLQRVAEAETNPALAASFQHEADAVRAVAETIKAAPVEVKSSIPIVDGGHTRTTWTCEFVDLKALLRAYVDGKVFLDEEAIKDGLQASMNRQAVTLQNNLGRAFPGVVAVPSYSAVKRRS